MYILVQKGTTFLKAEIKFGHTLLPTLLGDRFSISHV